MTLLSAILSLATILGGIAAIWFFWDRIRILTELRRVESSRSNDRNTVFPINREGMFAGTIQDLAKLILEVRLAAQRGQSRPVSLHSAPLQSTRRELERIRKKNVLPSLI